MSILRGRGIRLAAALIALICGAFLLAGEHAAQASIAPAGGLWVGAGARWLWLFAAALIAFAALVLGIIRLDLPARRSRARLLREAEHMASSEHPYAVVAVKAVGFGQLTRRRRSGALNSLRLYLDSFVEPGERCAPVGRQRFALILRCEDRSAFEKRLAILEQDMGLLFMASHPSKRLGARVAACRIDEAGGAVRALRLAMSDFQGARPAKGAGPRKKSA